MPMLNPDLERSDMVRVTKVADEMRASHSAQGEQLRGLDVRHLVAGGANLQSVARL